MSITPSVSGLTRRCRGTGMLICRCLGDGCCCDNHGYADCPGCEDCEWSDDDRDETYPGEPDELPVSA
jgi:hypothetical protein